MQPVEISSSSPDLRDSDPRTAAACNYAFVARFPSMKPKEMLRVLTRDPLNYEIYQQSGSHRKLRASGRPQLIFAYHDGATIAPGMVRKMLVKDVGLSEEEALRLVSGRRVGRKTQ